MRPIGGAGASADVDVAAAGLIGLLFVVVTLTAGFDHAQASRGAKLYMTPTALTDSTAAKCSAVGVM